MKKGVLRKHMLNRARATVYTLDSGVTIAYKARLASSAKSITFYCPPAGSRLPFKVANT